MGLGAGVRRGAAAHHLVALVRDETPGDRSGAPAAMQPGALRFEGVSSPAQAGRPGIAIPGGSWVMARMLPSESVNHADALPLVGSRATPFSVVGP